MATTFEEGFWDMVQACEAQDLLIDRRQLPLLRLFFHSGGAFADPTPFGNAWTRSVSEAAWRYRTQTKST
jgi:hypothetical protein